LEIEEIESFREKRGLRMKSERAIWEARTPEIRKEEKKEKREKEGWVERFERW
jgi:hypothetical protein